MNEEIKSKRATLRDLVQKTRGMGREAELRTKDFVSNQHEYDYRRKAESDKVTNKLASMGLYGQYGRLTPSQKDAQSKAMRNIPLDKITTHQSHVSRQELGKKIAKGSVNKDADPRFPVYIKQGDKYRTFDGNHRTIARKMRGFKNIRGIVIEMISFRQFLLEAVRDPERAANLLTKIGARQRKNTAAKGHIDIPQDANYPHDASRELHGHIWGKDKLPRRWRKEEREIPLSQIKITQDSIATNNAAKLARNFDTNHPGGHIHVYEAGDDEYHVIDGHHRLYAQKARGAKTVKAKVYWERS